MSYVLANICFSTKCRVVEAVLTACRIRSPLGVVTVLLVLFVQLRIRLGYTASSISKLQIIAPEYSMRFNHAYFWDWLCFT